MDGTVGCEHLSVPRSGPENYVGEVQRQSPPLAENQRQDLFRSALSLFQLGEKAVGRVGLDSTTRCEDPNPETEDANAPSAPRLASHFQQVFRLLGTAQPSERNAENLSGATQSVVQHGLESPAW